MSFVLALVVVIGQALQNTPKPIQCCKPIRLELAMVNDFSAPFETVLEHLRENAEQFGEALENLLPRTRYAFTSFVDKPVPFLGYGWGDFNHDVFYEDYCYNNDTQGFVTSNQLASAMQLISPVSGGNDIAGNQFGAMLNAALDPTLNWSDDKDRDGTTVVKIMSLLTQSVSHGLNLAKQAKASGGKWPSIPNATRGWDLWWSAAYWNYSFGRHLESEVFGNVPYNSWVWPTALQNSYSNDCYFGSATLSDYVLIGDRKITNEEELDEESERRWQEVLLKCAPGNIWKELGVPDSDALAKNIHDGKFLEESKCKSVEYPNQDQVIRALASKNIKPVVIVAKDVPERMNSDATIYYRWAYGCNSTQEHKCVEEFYSDALEGSGIETRTADMFQSIETWMEQLLDLISGIVQEECSVCPESTAVVDTTPAAEESTAPIPIAFGW